MNPEDDIERVLFRAGDIESAVRRIAAEVTRHYDGRPFTVVAVLKGSFHFASDLVRCIPLPVEIAFAAISSYRSGDRSGEISIEFLPHEREIAGRDVLLV